MRTTTADIRGLVDRIDRGEIRLPEIQRGYVWKPPKVAALIDSLYRHYPSGSLLLWETDEDVVERNPSIEGPGEKPLNRPQYLIDGQQRITSLHRVFKGHEDARIVFNVETERFQNESAATKKDPRWIAVYDLLSEADDTYTLVSGLLDRLPGMDSKVLSARIDGVKKVADYLYFIEILDDLSYEEVTEIFVRVNSRGVALRSVDLALATLSARWHGVIAELENEAGRWSAVGYSVISVPFLARCLAALATEVGAFRGFASASLEALEDGWVRTRRGVEHLVPLLKNNARIATSELVPSENALVPLVAYLGLRPDEALTDQDADALIYWLFGAFIQGRYSGSTETVLGQDLRAVRSSNPMSGLFRNLGLLGQRLVITDEALAGRTERSPYFLLSYLAAREAGARDWWHGVDICTDSEGHFSLEYHHVHPRATLRADYSKAEINDLANLAFISSRANKKIRDRSPAVYFSEIGDEQLKAHLVPLGEDLRTADRYPEFIRARRKLLAEAMTSVLDDFAPEHLERPSDAPDPAAGERLVLAAFGRSASDPSAELVFIAAANGTRWEASVSLRDFSLFLTDLENGYSAALSIGHETVDLDGGADAVELPLGPLAVRGTLDEWRAILDRELNDIAPLGDRPSIAEVPGWEGERVDFPIVDSE
jgi:hypothetical protein